MRPPGIDLSEARHRLRRLISFRGRLFWDLGDREWTDAERRERFEAVFETCWRGGMSRQAVANMIGQAAHREGKSFDESLEAYYRLYAVGRRREQ